jgi:O-antigen ligase
MNKAILFSPLAIFFVIVLNYKLSIYLFPGYFLYDIKRILELALLLWLALFLLISFRERRVWLRTYNLLPVKARLGIFVIFLLGILSSALAPLPKMALLEVSLFFLMFCFIIFIAGKRITIGVCADNIILFVIMLGVVIYEIIFIYSYPIRYFLGFVNPRFLAQFCTWTLPLVSLPVFWRKGKIITFIIASLWWSIAIANSAKGMFLALLIAGIFAAAVFRGAIKKWLLIQLQVIFAGIILYLLLFIKLTGLTSVANSLFGRLPLWQGAIKLIITHPFLGVGPLHYSYYPNPIAAHPHNSLLLIASEWGIPVLILVLILFISGIKSWLQKFNHKTAAVVPIALTVSLISAGGYSLVSGVLVMPLSQVMLGIISGWMLGIYYAD